MGSILLAAGENAFLLPSLVGVIIGVGLMVAYQIVIGKKNVSAAQREAQSILSAAETRRDEIKRAAEVETKAEFVKRQQEFDKETQASRNELREVERRLEKREDQLDKKLDMLNIKEKNIEKGESRIREMTTEIEGKQKEIGEMLVKGRNELLRITQLSMDEARRQLFDRLAGRNIRAIEKATGVDIIVDDTPGVIILSCFDPVRKEIARQSLTKLIQDGRIHPTRVEEVVTEITANVEKEVIEIGKRAALEANVQGLNRKLIELLGRLHYRTSYSQNVLRHSIEVAYLCQIMAEELGLNGALARRCGLLHDIGKAVPQDMEGTHPAIGEEICRKVGERPEVLNAVAGHHGDIPATSPYTPLVASADAISAARPGSRRESMERYIKRLQDLEFIATSFNGVTQAYAIQAGREIRVIVDANRVDDSSAMRIARDVAKKIESDMTYPGEIKVTLLREVRAVEYAR
ncbi:MAG: ribonuclease Y [Planctomycetes bacterium]|nr:ribonuclease Y [Planctomycetota bacterium]